MPKQLLPNSIQAELSMLMGVRYIEMIFFLIGTLKMVPLGFDIPYNKSFAFLSMQLLANALSRDD